MEFTDFNELKRLMKEGARDQRHAMDDDDDFQFETKYDGDSYHKNQIHSYANASTKQDKYALFRGSNVNQNTSTAGNNSDNNKNRINPNNTYETYKNANAANSNANNNSIVTSDIQRDRENSDDTNGGGQIGYEESSSGSSSSSDDDVSDSEYFSFDATKIQSIIEESDEASDREEEEIKDQQQISQNNQTTSNTSQQLNSKQTQQHDMQQQERQEIQQQVAQIEQKIKKENLLDQKRKSTFQAKFESKRAKEQLQKDILGEYQMDKVLTFRDMSHLSYFGGLKKQQQNQLYKDDTNLQNRQQLLQQTPLELAKEILYDIIDVVIGDVTMSNDQIITESGGMGIVNDKIIMDNFDQLRKKVFVKEKIEIINPMKSIVGSSSYEDKQQQNTQQSMQTSLLSTIIDNIADGANDFLLPTPSVGDSSAISIKIYLFSTPKCLKIYIYRKSTVQDVIKHIMTLYSKDQLLSKDQPLIYPGIPDAYELRIIDDDVDYFAPFYDIGPLDRKDEIGEFESLAFIENKSYITQRNNSRNDSTECDLNQSKQEEEQLKKQNVSNNICYIEYNQVMQKRLINVHVNTSLLKTNFSQIMNQDDTVRDLIVQVSQKAGENFLNSKLYILVQVLKEQQSKFGLNQATISQFGGQITAFQDNLFNIAQSSGRFDYDANYINWNTIIRNLKTPNVMLTDKVYVDKPIKKQKEVPMQKKKDLEMTFKEKNVLQLLKTTQQPNNNGLQVNTQNTQDTSSQNSISPDKEPGLTQSQSVISPSRLPKMKSQIIPANSSNEKQEDHRQEDDFLFGSISAARYQEFLVTKINRRGKRQTRVLAVDGLNIYNVRKSQAKDGKGGQSVITMPNEKEKKRGSFFSGFLGKKLLGVKRKARTINSIDEIQKINNQTITIVFIEKNGTKKAIVYECMSADNCSEIIAKLNFLRKNQEKPLTLKRNTQLQVMMPQAQISSSVQQPSMILGSQKYPY